ncbi:GAF domain-containing protein [Natronomonas halophila]|uniref:ATP-binding protein n=1 Tax=Natronomonas halophila TaxID=2747817 RepID=UPI0015B3BDA9|nr:ATP-binding protein [Natronomonas halophila]QLD87257.1 GAF domain-containing protein [Natronomonas halophila]
MNERSPVLESLPESVIIIDTDGRISYANAFAADLFEYDREDLEGIEVTKLLPGIDIGSEPTGPRRGRKADGEPLEVAVRFRTHGDEYIAVVNDLSERTWYERTLERLQTVAAQLLGADTVEELAEACVNAVVDVLDLRIAAVHLYDEASNTLEPAAVSPTLNKLVDGSPSVDGPESIAWKAFTEGEPRGAIDSDETRSYTEDTAVYSELVFPLGEWGVLIVGTTEARPFTEREHRMAGLLATTVTVAIERVDHEASLRKQNERLEQLAGTLSHDLRDPLNTAQMTTKLARNAAENDETTDYIDDLEDVLDRMEQLIEDLLTLAREGRAVGERQPVELRDAVNAAWDTVGSDAATLAVESSATISADPERLRTLFENLLGNAVRHGGDDVTVRIGMFDTGTGFYVADDGPGIPEDDREDVFNHGVTTRENGTGFGLSIVRTIADAHGWSVRATDSESDGARLEITGLTGMARPHEP